MVAGRPASAYLPRMRVMWVFTVADVMKRLEAAACLLSARTQALNTSTSRVLSDGLRQGLGAETRLVCMALLFNEGRVVRLSGWCIED